MSEEIVEPSVKRSRFDNLVPDLSRCSSSYLLSGNPIDHPLYHPSDDAPWEYANVRAAAPMVRISSLPFRIACKMYGANMLYSEEIIAKKLMTCRRVTNLCDLYTSTNIVSHNDALPQANWHAPFVHFLEPRIIEVLQQRVLKTHLPYGSFISSINLEEIDTNTSTLPSTEELARQQQLCSEIPTSTIAQYNAFSMLSCNSTLTTYPRERLVLQLGVNDAIDAVKAVEIVHADIRAVDINMGCPKAFSTHAFFGSELLTRPELMEDVVSTLHRQFPTLPVTIKIRMLSDPRHTLELIRRAEHMGVSAIAVHARYKPDRPRFQAQPLQQMSLLSSFARVPLLYNGDIYTSNEIEQYMSLCAGKSYDSFQSTTATVEGGETSSSVSVGDKSYSSLPNYDRIGGVLIARGAQYNPSVFGQFLPRSGPEPCSVDSFNVAELRAQQDADTCSQAPLLEQSNNSAEPQIEDDQVTEAPKTTLLALAHPNLLASPPVWDPITRCRAANPVLARNKAVNQLLQIYLRQFYRNLEPAASSFLAHTSPTATPAKTSQLQVLVDGKAFQPIPREDFIPVIEQVDQFLHQRDELISKADGDYAKALEILVPPTTTNEQPQENPSEATSNSAEPNKQDTTIQQPRKRVIQNAMETPFAKLTQHLRNTYPSLLPFFQNTDPTENPHHTWSFADETIMAISGSKTAHQPNMLGCGYSLLFYAIITNYLQMSLPNIKYICTTLLGQQSSMCRQVGYTVVSGSTTSQHLLPIASKFESDVLLRPLHPAPIGHHEIRTNQQDASTKKKKKK